MLGTKSPDALKVEMCVLVDFLSTAARPCQIQVEEYCGTKGSKYTERESMSASNELPSIGHRRSIPGSYHRPSLSESGSSRI